MSNESTIKDEVKGINWHTTIFIALFHVGAVAALFMFSWPALIVAIVLWWITASLGVGMGFHRQLTHRSFRTPKIVEYFLTDRKSTCLNSSHIPLSRMPSSA